MIHGQWQKNKVKYKLETHKWNDNTVSICVYKNDHGSGSSNCITIPLKHFNQMVKDCKGD